MATSEKKMSQLPLATSLEDTDKILVLKSNVTSTATIGTVNANAFLGKSTSNLTEGTNLYFTSSRVKTKVNSMLVAGTNVSLVVNDALETITINAISPITSVNTKVGNVVLDTNDITEAGNLYFTNERVDDRVASLLQAGSNVSLSYNDVANTLTINSTGNVTSVNSLVGSVVLTTDNISEGGTNKYFTTTAFNTSFSTKTTSNLLEGSNLYFTETRVRTTPLTGLLGGVDSSIGSTDTILDAFSKVQAQITSAKSLTNTHAARTDNPHGVTKAQIGLSNVPNVDTTSANAILSGTLADARLTSNVTLQGNTFNVANTLLKLNNDGKLPALDGSLLTGLVNQLSNLTDILFSSPQSGDILSYNGTKWINSTGLFTVRHDFSSNYSYVGRAAKGSSEGSSVWKITRIEVLTDGNTISTTALNVTWSGRLSHTYT